MARGLLSTQRTFEEVFKDKKVKIIVKHLKRSKVRYTKRFDSGNPIQDIKDAQEYIKKRKASNLILTKELSKGK